MAKKWKAGVIGCGAIAQALHIPGYIRTPNVELTAVCDPVAKRLSEAKGFQAELNTYKDYRAMFKKEQLDVVSVATPNKFHTEHAIAALEHGAHVVLEKPAALSMAEIAKIKAAVKKSGKQLIVGFSHRFMAGNRKIHKLLEEGTIGDVYMIRWRLAHAGPFPGWAKDKWFYDPKLAGAGVILDMGVHVIDQCLWHLGPIKKVQAMARTLRKNIKLDDNALILLEFEKSKALGYIDVSWTSPTGFNGVEIMGDKGSIVQSYAAGGQTVVTVGNATPDMNVAVNLKTRVAHREPGKGGWVTEIPECVRAFRKNDNLDCGIEVGGNAVAVALAALESSKTGKACKPQRVR